MFVKHSALLHCQSSYSSFSKPFEIFLKKSRSPFFLQHAKRFETSWQCSTQFRQNFRMHFPLKKAKQYFLQALGLWARDRANIHSFARTSNLPSRWLIFLGRKGADVGRKRIESPWKRILPWKPRATACERVYHRSVPVGVFMSTGRFRLHAYDYRNKSVRLTFIEPCVNFLLPRQWAITLLSHYFKTPACESWL